MDDDEKFESLDREMLIEIAIGQRAEVERLQAELVEARATTADAEKIINRLISEIQQRAINADRASIEQQQKIDEAREMLREATAELEKLRVVAFKKEWEEHDAATKAEPESPA